MQARHAQAAERSAQVLPPAAQALGPSPPALLYPAPPPPPRYTTPPPIALDASATQGPPVHSNHHHAASIQTSGPVQQRSSSQRSRWDAPPAPVGGQWNSQSIRQQPEQHAARQSVPSRDASPEQLAQHLQSLSLQPANHAGTVELSLGCKTGFPNMFTAMNPHSFFAGTSTGRPQAGNQPVAMRPNQPAFQDAAAILQVHLV